MNDLDQVFVRSNLTAFERAVDETIILDLGSGNYFGVSEVGGFIWERLDGSSDLGSIAAQVVEAFDADLETVCADLLGLIESLLDLGLVRPAEAGE